MNNTCKAVTKAHIDAAEKISAFTAKELSVIEGKIEGMLEDKDEMLRMGWSDAEIAEANEIIEKINAYDSSNGGNTDDAMIGVYRNMVRLYLDTMHRADAVMDYRSKNEPKEITDMMNSIGGIERAELTVEIAVRFSDKVSIIQSENPGLSRSKIVRGVKRLNVGGPMKIFESIREDMELERWRAANLLSLYEQMVVDKEAGKDVFFIESEIDTIEADNAFLKRIVSDANENVDGSTASVAVRTARLREAVREYDALLGSWAPMCRLSCNAICVMEGMSIDGQMKVRERMEEISLDGDGWLRRDDEESTEDIFRTSSEFRASWSSVPGEIRSLLSKIPVMDSWTGVRPVNRIGGIKRMDPQRAFEHLLTQLRTSGDSIEMLDILSKLCIMEKQYVPLLDMLENDSGLCTDMWQAIKRGQQVYTQFATIYTNGIRRVIMTVLNGRINKVRSSFTSVKQFRKINFSKYILEGIGNGLSCGDLTDQLYDSTGRYREEAVNKFDQIVSAWAVPKEINDNFSMYGYKLKSPLEMSARERYYHDEVGLGDVANWDAMRYNVIMQISNALGIELTPEMAVGLLKNSGLMRQYLDAFRTIVYEHSTGLRVVDQESQWASGHTIFHTRMEAAKKKQAEDPNAVTRFSVLQADDRNMAQGYIEDAFRTIDWVRSRVSTHGDYSNRARAKSGNGKSDRTYESAIEPSFMTNMIDKLHSFGKDVDKGNKKFREYLDKMWLSDEKFMSRGSNGGDGLVYNPWIRAWKYEMESRGIMDKTFPDSSDIATEVFDFVRDLGTSDKAFENASDKEHALWMITSYFRNEATRTDEKFKEKIIYLTAAEFAEIYNNKELLKRNGTCRYVVSGYFEIDKDSGKMNVIGSVSDKITTGYRPMNTVTVLIGKKSEGDENEIYDIKFGDKVPNGTYQMFVQGDSGASRYVFAPRYCVEDVIEEMYNLYLGEIARMRQVREMQNDKKFVKNYTVDKNGNMKNGDSFTMLTFLNSIIDELWEKYEKEGMSDSLPFEGEPSSKAEMITMLDPEFVKDAIRKNMENQFVEFMAELSDMGLLETEKRTSKKYGNKETHESYTYLEQIVDGQETIYDRTGREGSEIDVKKNILMRRMRDYYYNHKLAQYCMMQVFGVDASMFANAEEIGKRFKQTVANGYILDMSVVYKDEHGNIDRSAAMRDGYERSIYVEDVLTDCEEHDPEFMEGILLKYCNDNDIEDAKSMIKNGICRKITASSLRAMSDETLNGMEWNVDGLSTENVKAMSGEELIDAAEVMNKERHKAIRKLIGDSMFENRYMPYTKNTLTDGQCWRSLESYRSIMIRRGGKWWTSREQKAYDTIKSLRKRAKEENRELTTKEIAEIESCAAIFQPLKPFSYGYEKIGYKVKDANGKDVVKNANIGCQHKCADVVIIPELLEPGSKLRAMAEMMSESFDEADADNTDTVRKIDCIYSTECVKVGIWDTLTLDGTADEFKARLKEAQTSGVGVHSLGWEYYRIQQNVPQHVIEERRIGTQLMKIGMSDLDFSSDANYSRYFEEDKTKGMYKSNPDKGICIGRYDDGSLMYANEKMSAVELSQLYQSQFVANLLNSIDEFARMLSTKKDISDKVISTLQSNMRTSIDKIYGFMIDSDSEGLERFIMPLFESAVEKDVAGALLSIFRNTVNKQTMLGGSAVQMSSMGLRKDYDMTGDLNFAYDEDHNAVYMECEMSWAEEYTDSRGRAVKLNFEDWNERTADGVWELKKDENGVPLIEKEFPGILDRLAYRIPTERCYSILNLRVKRFTPMTAGGTIKVPHQCTTIAGFDFDIDKLYMLRRSFEENKSEWERLDLTKEQRSQIVEKIKELHPEFVMEMPSVTEESFSDVQLGEIFQVIYGEHPDIKISEKDAPRGIKEALKQARRGNEKKYKYLNRYWNESDGIKAMAANRGMTSDAYKSYLVQKAAEALNITPDKLVETKSGYSAINRDAIAASQTTMGALFKEAADELGISLGEDKREKRWKEYDLSKPPLEQESDGVRTNMILHILQQRMADPETFYSRTTPGGFEEAKRVSHMMKYLTIFGPEDADASTAYSDSVAYSKNKGQQKSLPYDYSEPMTLIRFNRQNQIAAKLIGVFANHSTNNIFSQLLGKFELTDGTESEESTDHRIRMFGKVGSKLVHRDDRKTRMQVDKFMAELLAASVDAVKDPVLDNLNITEDTANIVALMIRTGFDFEEVGLFLNQPVIKEVCNLMRRNGYGINRAVSEISEKMFDGDKIEKPYESNIINKKDCVNDILEYRRKKENDKKNVISSMREERSMPEGSQGLTQIDNGFLERQKAVLAMFVDMAGSAQQLSDWLMTTKFTASGTIGSTAGAIYSVLHKTESNNMPKNFSISYSTSYGENKDGRTIRYDQSFSSDNTEYDINQILEYGTDEEKSKLMTWICKTPFSIEQAMYNCLKFAMKKVIGKVMPYESDRYRKLMDLLSIVSNGMINSDILDGMFSDIQLWELSRRGGSMFDMETKVEYKYLGKTKNMTYREYLAKYFGNDFYDFTMKYWDKLSKYKLFNEALEIKSDKWDNVKEGKDDTKHVMMTSIASNSTFRDQIQSEIMEIQQHWIMKDGGEDQEFYDKTMEMLIKMYQYGVLCSGIDMKTSNFNTLFPNSFKRNIEMERNGEGIVKYYDEVIGSLIEDSGMSDEELTDSMRNFITGYVVKHLTSCWTMTKWINQNEEKPDFEITSIPKIKEENITKLLFRGEEQFDKICLKKDSEEWTFPPVIIIGKPNKSSDVKNDAKVCILDGRTLAENGFKGNPNEVPYIYVGTYHEIIENAITYNPNSQSIISVTSLKANTENTSEDVSAVPENGQYISERTEHNPAEMYKYIMDTLEKLKDRGEDISGKMMELESMKDNIEKMRTKFKEWGLAPALGANGLPLC